MKINRNYLSKVMHLANRFVPSGKVANEALRFVRIQVHEAGVMFVSATNTKDAFFARLPVTDPKPFAALVPAAMLNSVLAKLTDEEIEFKNLKNHFVIQRKSGDIRIMTMDLGYFPALPPIDKATNWIEIETEDIHGMVRSLLCGTQEELVTPQQYKNVAKIRSAGPEFLATATDGNRLALVDGKCSSEAGIELEVPLRALRTLDASLNDLKGSKTVHLGEDKTQIWIKVNDNLQFSFTKFAGVSYPDVDKMISAVQFDKHCSIDTPVIREAIDLARLVGNESLRFEFKGNKGLVAAAKSDVGDLSQQFEIRQITPFEIVTGYNVDYITPILQRIDNKAVDFSFCYTPATGNRPETYTLRITQDGERLRSSWIVQSLNKYPGSKSLEKKDETSN